MSQRAWSSIKPGDIIEWEETLCRNRGTYRVNKITVLSRRGKNIESTDGSWHYWGSRDLGNNSTKITKGKP